MAATQILNTPVPYVSGLKMSYIDNVTFMIAAGASRDSTNSFDITLLTDTIVDTSTVGPNGMDFTIYPPGAAAYPVYLIGSSTGEKPTACVGSFNYDMPNLPEGYDIFKRVAWMNYFQFPNPLEPFSQFGEGRDRSYIFKTNYFLMDVTAVSEFEPITTLKNIVPPINTEASFILYADTLLAPVFLFNPILNYDPAQGFQFFLEKSTYFLPATVPCSLDANGQAVTYVRFPGDPAGSPKIYCNGYKDYL